MALVPGAAYASRAQAAMTALSDLNLHLERALEELGTPVTGIIDTPFDTPQQARQGAGGGAVNFGHLSTASLAADSAGPATGRSSLEGSPRSMCRAASTATTLSASACPSTQDLDLVPQSEPEEAAHLTAGGDGCSDTSCPDMPERSAPPLMCSSAVGEGCRLVAAGTGAALALHGPCGIQRSRCDADSDADTGKCDGGRNHSTAGKRSFLFSGACLRPLSKGTLSCTSLEERMQVGEHLRAGAQQSGAGRLAPFGSFLPCLQRAREEEPTCPLSGRQVPTRQSVSEPEFVARCIQPRL